MVSERDRIINLIDYLESLGIKVTINKNKAQGNKGFFKTKSGEYAITIAKGLNDKEIVSVLVHEFAHYLHYCYDKKLQSLDFIFENLTPEIEEELINLTVLQVPKRNAKLLFDLKSEINEQIKILYEEIVTNNPDFLLTKPYKKFELLAQKSNIKYLLKHDKVNVLELFTVKIYLIDNIEKDFQYCEPDLIKYVRLKSLQRKIKRINARIAKLNKYYNSYTEMFARSLQAYFCDYEHSYEYAPNIFEKYNKFIKNGNNLLLKNFYETFFKCIDNFN